MAQAKNDELKREALLFVSTIIAVCAIAYLLILALSGYVVAQAVLSFAGLAIGGYFLFRILKWSARLTFYLAGAVLALCLMVVVGVLNFLGAAWRGEIRP